MSAGILRIPYALRTPGKRLSGASGGGGLQPEQEDIGRGGCIGKCRISINTPFTLNENHPVLVNRKIYVPTLFLFKIVW